MELTIGGWIFLVVVWGVVGGLCTYCMYKIFFGKRPTSADQQKGEAA
jgi:uncharacterized membrane-anchored protein